MAHASIRARYHTREAAEYLLKLLDQTSDRERRLNIIEATIVDAQADGLEQALVTGPTLGRESIERMASFSRRDATRLRSDARFPAEGEENVIRIGRGGRR